MRKAAKPQTEHVYVLRCIDPTDDDVDLIVGVYRSLNRARQEASNEEYELRNYGARHFKWECRGAEAWETAREPDPLDSFYRIDRKPVRK